MKPSAIRRTPRSGFDRVARAYRWLEYLSFGAALERCRSRYLADMLTARRALVLGDGDGRFTALLMRHNPHVLVDACDASAAMLALLEKRVSRLRAQPRLRTAQADLRRGLPQILLDPLPEGSQGYDLVVTHFLLDCFTTRETARLALEVHAATAPCAQWIVSEFATPHLAAQAVVGALYLAFAVLTGLETRQLPAYSEALGAAEFSLVEEEHRLCGLLTTSRWRRIERT